LIDIEVELAAACLMFLVSGNAIQLFECKSYWHTLAQVFFTKIMGRAAMRSLFLSVTWYLHCKNNYLE
jgi:hypothetical protein